MEKTYDKETGVKTWLINKWYQKTIYVFGAIGIIFYAATFVIAFIAGIVEAMIE